MLIFHRIQIKTPQCISCFDLLECGNLDSCEFLANEILNFDDLQTKSKLDWDSYKKQEGIEEDLKIHNRGKDG